MVTLKMQISDPPSKPKISIIIVSYNSQKDIELLIKQLIETLEFRNEFEIIIVSNSNDCVNLPEKYADRVVQSSGNVGFGAGCNNGAHVANGEYLLFCNPDVRISSPKIISLYESLKRRPEVGMLSPIFKEQEYQSNGPIVVEEGRVIGACLCISRELFTQIGEWDESFFLWGEDRDLATRIRKKSLDVAVHTGILAEHIGGNSWKNSNSKQEKYLTKVWLCSQLNYHFKHKGALGAYKYLVIDILKNVLRLLLRIETLGRINCVKTSTLFGLKLLFSRNLKKLVVFNHLAYPFENKERL
jgi:N-acetylglucosaminyl-diphospho-decaprenol L-rhamnosyltransferase